MKIAATIAGRYRKEGRDGRFRRRSAVFPPRITAAGMYTQ
jgi:hypothetical protein